MRFIALLFALAGAACAALFILQPGRASQAAPQPPAAQSRPAVEATVATPAPAAAPVAVAAPSPRPAAQKPAAAPRPAPGPKEPAQQPAPAPAPLPTVTIQPPRGLEGVAFGMSDGQIASRFPPAWRRESQGVLTLVYYPQGDGDQVRFHFSQQGLTKLELLLKPPEGQDLSHFYQTVREQYGAVYGSLRGSAGDGWNDGRTVLRVSLEPTAVSVLFYPKG